MPSWNKPTQEQIEKVIAALAHPAQRRYFFDKLENPEWIEPLGNYGFFINVPEVNIDSLGNIIQCPPWPESKFLAKVASESPQKIHDIFIALDIKNNTTVLADLVKSAAKIPQDLSIELMYQKIIPWIKNCNHLPFNICESSLQLLEHLIAGGKTVEAFELVENIFEIIPNDKELSNAFIEILPRPQAKLEPWQYEVYLYKAIELFYGILDTKLIFILGSVLSQRSL